MQIIIMVDRNGHTLEISKLSALLDYFRRAMVTSTFLRDRRGVSMSISITIYFPTGTILRIVEISFM